jgi:hypothetical protein
MREKDRPPVRQREHYSPTALRNAGCAASERAGRRLFEIVEARTRKILASR